MSWPPLIGDTLPRAADAWCIEEKWVAWILADNGHGREWRTVLKIDASDWGVAWVALKDAVQEAPIETVRIPESGGVSCGLTVELRIGERAAAVGSAWHYGGPRAAPRLVTAYPKPYNRAHGGGA